MPGVHQVLLQVRVAELNRTAIREIGAEIMGVDPKTGNIMGTRIGGAGAPGLITPGGAVSALGLLGLGGSTSSGAMGNASPATVFGVFPSGDFEIMYPRPAEQLAVVDSGRAQPDGDEWPSSELPGRRPVSGPDTQATGGVASSITVEWKDFGVQLDFVPYVLEDETIRMMVTPEVSSIDFALGTMLVPGGTITPGLNTRRATTTVELRQGQTLAIAGLLAGGTQRQHEPRARTGRPTLPWAVVQQHEPQAGGKGAASAGDPVPRQCHESRPSSSIARRRLERPQRLRILSAESDRRAHGTRFPFDHQLGRSVETGAADETGTVLRWAPLDSQNNTKEVSSNAIHTAYDWPKNMSGAVPVCAAKMGLSPFQRTSGRSLRHACCS